jgi:hypothetical protein
MKRREFLKASMAATALTGIGGSTMTSQAAEPNPAGREFYELRAYRFKAGMDHALLDGYLEKALIPALNRLKVQPVGVFTDLEPKDDTTVYVLIPHATIEAFSTLTGRLNDDAEYLKAGANYLQTPKNKPGFDRMDSWLLLAFSGLPKMDPPVWSREKKPRLFEMRTYQSHSEVKAQNKVDMFNAGEVEIMREIGLGPIFFGQTLIGKDMPHLMYMTSGENREVHKQHWDAFGSHPIWKKLIGDPKYADNVIKNTQVFLAPKPYSQI